MILLNGTNFEIKPVKSNIGVFDVAYILHNIDEDTVQSVIDWLAENCSDNFIVTKTSHRIVAGGYVDNKQAYKNGRFKLKSSRKNNHITDSDVSYEVRLHNFDSVMFSMVWLNEKVEI
jgi:hypothetical protein